MPKHKTESTGDTSSCAVGVADIEQIVQKAVEAAVTVVRNEFQKMYQDMNARLQSVEEKLEKVSDAIEHQVIDRQSTDLSTELSRLTVDLEAARKEARDAMILANDAEQYNRRNNIRIRGLSVQQNEDCRQKVIEFVRTALHVELCENDIEAAHVLPSHRKASERDSGAQAASNRGQALPTVIVRFRNRDTRDTVVRNRSKLKSTNRSIVEDLTSLNARVMNRLRNHELIQKVWSWNGHITAMTVLGKKIHVKPFQTVEDCIAGRS